MAHMDVVEARAERLEDDPFEFLEKDGYFYGRGTSDDKQGVVATTVALIKLRAEGFKPNRDIILFYTGDEETQGKGAELGATEWRKLTEAEFALNADGGGGAFTRTAGRSDSACRPPRRPSRPITFTRPQPGGHSSPAAAGQCDLRAGRRAEEARGAPVHADAQRDHAGLFHRTRQAGGQQCARQRDARWLANPDDGAAADASRATSSKSA